MDDRYNQDFFVSWEELHRDTRTLCRKLLAMKADFRGIITVTRGRLVPSAIVARELGIGRIDTVCVSSYHGDEAQERADDVPVIKPAEGDGTDMLLIDETRI